MYDEAYSCIYFFSSRPFTKHIYIYIYNLTVAENRHFLAIVILKKYTSLISFYPMNTDNSEQCCPDLCERKEVVVIGMQYFIHIDSK